MNRRQYHKNIFLSRDCTPRAGMLIYYCFHKKGGYMREPKGDEEDEENEREFRRQEDVRSITSPGRATFGQILATIICLSWRPTRW
jgi:hypothetical protein